MIDTIYKDINNKVIQFKDKVKYEKEKYIVIYDNRKKEISILNLNDESIILSLKDISTKVEILELKR